MTRGPWKPLPDGHALLAFLGTLRRRGLDDRSPTLVAVCRCYFAQHEALTGTPHRLDHRRVALACKQLDIAVTRARSNRPTLVAVDPAHVARVTQDAQQVLDARRAAAPLDGWTLALAQLVGVAPLRSALGDALPRRRCGLLPDYDGDPHAVAWERSRGARECPCGKADLRIWGDRDPDAPLPCPRCDRGL